MMRRSSAGVLRHYRKPAPGTNRTVHAYAHAGVDRRAALNRRGAAVPANGRLARVGIAQAGTHLTFMAVSADLFDSPGPDGFAYGAELFTPSEERAFVARIETLPFKPFEFHGYLGNRRIVSFGYRYDYAARALNPAAPMPDFLEPLKEIAARFSAIPAQKLQQALVSEYAPGAGIGWHKDKPMFEDVVALSFLAPCVLRLRRRRSASQSQDTRQGWMRRAVPVAPRSGYLLRGPAREVWEHSIAPMPVLRYSVTFRSFRPGYRGPR
jgi:alkylated DNA repair dioxygenase AlkB